MTLTLQRLLLIVIVTAGVTVYRTYAVRFHYESKRKSQEPVHHGVTYDDRQPADQQHIEDISCDSNDSSNRIMVGLTPVTCNELAQNYVIFCYNKSFRNRCCQSCSRAKISQDYCEWGDRRDCSETNPVSCNKRKTRYSCCKTCEELRIRLNDNTGIVVAELFCSAYGVPPHYKFKRNMHENCDDNPGLVNVGEHQYTCQDMVKNNGSFCYVPLLKNKCCKSCESIVSVKNLSEIANYCPYGDKDNKFCFDVKPWECYNKEHRDTCCESCYLKYFKGENPPRGADCPYGDQKFWCMDIKRSQCDDNNNGQICCATCEGYGSENGKAATYPPQRGTTIWDYQAQTDPDHEKDISCTTDNISGTLTLGTQPVTCEELVTHNVTHCYNKWFRDRCCQSCNRVRRSIPYCEWGNKRDCTNHSPISCNRRSDRYLCCQMCEEIREQRYRAKQKNPKDYDDCPYGDKEYFCQGKTRSQCSEESTKKYCCELCA